MKRGLVLSTPAKMILILIAIVAIIIFYIKFVTKAEYQTHNIYKVSKNLEETANKTIEDFIKG